MKHARADYNRIQDPAGLIPEDEPVFLLRGQDVLAPELLELYARRTMETSGNATVAELTRNQAQKMREWPKKKMADIPRQEVPGANL